MRAAIIYPCPAVGYKVCQDVTTETRVHCVLYHPRWYLPSHFLVSLIDLNASLFFVSFSTIDCSGPEKLGLGLGGGAMYHVANHGVQ